MPTKDTGMKDDIERKARAAAEFLMTEYGSDLMEAFASLNYRMHQEAEKASSIESTGLLVAQAYGVRQCIDILTKDAEMYNTGYFDKVREAEKEAEVDEQIAP